VHVVASVREVDAATAVEPAAVDDQRIVAIVERSPLDPLVVEVKLGNPIGSRSSNSRRSASLTFMFTFTFSPPCR
jgi:hypothetical protein